MKYLLYAAVFAVVMYFGIQQAMEMDDSRDWPTTQGVIIESHIFSTLETSTKFGGRDQVHEVRVLYSYAANGTHYSSNRLRIHPNRYRTEGTAKRELAQYPARKKVKVYYDPEKPERSVLSLR